MGSAQVPLGAYCQVKEPYHITQSQRPERQTGILQGAVSTVWNGCLLTPAMPGQVPLYRWRRTAQRERWTLTERSDGTLGAAAQAIRGFRDGDVNGFPCRPINTSTAMFRCSGAIGPGVEGGIVPCVPSSESSCVALALRIGVCQSAAE